MNNWDNCSTLKPPRTTEQNTVPDKFDAYREALIVEQETVWPEEFDHLEPDEKAHFEEQLHADPENASRLEYVRMHTGFCRQITVTEEDLERVQA